MERQAKCETISWLRGLIQMILSGKILVLVRLNARGTLPNCAGGISSTQIMSETVDLHTIGLTGGIGTGKSEVAATLETLGACIIDADQHGHEAYAKGTMGWRRIREIFGEGVLTEDMEVDRQKLGHLVFNNQEAMAWLNSAIHPIMEERIRAQVANLSDSGYEVIVVEAAVLVDAGWDSLVDEVWVIESEEDLVTKRISERRNQEPWEIRSRITSQKSMVQRAKKRADFVIRNTGTREELQIEVKRLWKERNLPRRQAQ